MTTSQRTTDTGTYSGPAFPLAGQPAVTYPPLPADEPAPTWQDCPDYHTTAATIATKLRLIAAALDTLGETPLAATYLDVSLQVTGDKNPEGRKAAVDTLAVALGCDPAKGGKYDTYRASTRGHESIVYTPKLHQPGCCEHCTVSGGTR